MTQPLLIEIGVEELPAVPLLKILNDIEKAWAKILEANRLLCAFGHKGQVITDNVLCKRKGCYPPRAKKA